MFSLECVIHKDTFIADLCVIYRVCHLYHLSIECVIYRDTCFTDLPRARFRLGERRNTRSSTISSEAEVSTISGEADHIAHLPRARFRLCDRMCFLENVSFIEILVLQNVFSTECVIYRDTCISCEYWRSAPCLVAPLRERKHYFKTRSSGRS